MQNSGYSAYSQNDITVESPEKLILMLYEGALRFISQARVSMVAKDREKKIYWINRTLAIYIELLNSLEYSAGDVTLYLDGLYRKEIELLAKANLDDDVKILDEVINVTKELTEAWRENVIGVKNEKLDK